MPEDARDGVRHDEDPQPVEPSRRRSLCYQRLDVYFFDMDDTLYQNQWTTAGMITKRIEKYCEEHLGLPKGKSMELYRKHGTCLRGLLQEGLLAEDKVDDYLEFCHDIPTVGISRDETLRAVLQIIPGSRWVFTAAPAKYWAERVLDTLGVRDLFEGIVDAVDCKFMTKHDPESFRIAMKKAGVTDPGRCVLLDDSAKNLVAAKEAGWQTVLVGPPRFADELRSGVADAVIKSVHHLPEALPQLFREEHRTPPNPESPVDGGN
eukprot:TRINITY_DN70956_c0_g1_i1.p1 TRINITY_DN70956_c0_g1~~TRINITY_DN70956_c0_g1_i1.p1  ORF type:complete len:263 (+),score=86.08 TRINITY_DN70956_c0_g1_i1:91-879(+)